MSTCPTCQKPFKPAPKECSCPLAGYCERHSIKKTEHWHHLCQSNDSYREVWDNGTGPGQPREISRKPIKMEVVAPPCPHNIDGECRIAALISGKKCSIRPDTCVACTESPRSQRLNIHTAMLAVMHNPDLDVSLLDSVIDGTHTGFGTKLSKTISKIPSTFGTTLSYYLEPFFQEYPGCGCPGLKDVLDVWTPDYIKKNMDYVVATLHQQARQRNLPFFRPAARYLLTRLLKEMSISKEMS